MLTDFQSVNTLGNLGVLARLLDAWAKIRVSQSDAVSIAARGIDNLTSRDGTVGVNPVAAADRRRWTGWRSPRSRPFALSVRTLPLRIRCWTTPAKLGLESASPGLYQLDALESRFGAIRLPGGGSRSPQAFQTHSSLCAAY